MEYVAVNLLRPKFGLTRCLGRVGHQFHVPNTTDKHGRLLVYMFFANSRTGLKTETMLCFVFWQVQTSSQTKVSLPSTLEFHFLHFRHWQIDWIVMKEPIASLRNGSACIADLKDFSFFKNLDMSAEARKMFGLLLDLYFSPTNWSLLCSIGPLICQALFLLVSELFTW